MLLYRLLVTPPLPWLLAIALATQLAVDPWRLASAEFALCVPPGSTGFASASSALGGRAVAWLAMVVSMMLPLLAQPLTEVWNASVRSRRPRAVSLFMIGYVSAWSIIGIPVAALFVPDGPLATVALMAVAVCWSASPISQRARNRCHRVPDVSAFGWKADRDCLRYGAGVALPCFANCWPWMTVVMGFDRWHLAAVPAVTTILILERAMPPAVARWQIPPALQALNALTVRQKVLGRP